MWFYELREGGSREPLIGDLIDSAKFMFDSSSEASRSRIIGTP